MPLLILTGLDIIMPLSWFRWWVVFLDLTFSRMNRVKIQVDPNRREVTALGSHLLKEAFLMRNWP